MGKNLKFRATLIAGLLLGCGNVSIASAMEPSAAEIDQMTDILLTMLPIGTIMETAAANDKTWPMQEAADKVSKAQLACMRSQLNSDGVRRMKRAEVAEYAQANAERFAADLKVARQAAPLFAELVQAGMASAQSDTQPDMSEQMKSATADQMIAMMSIVNDSKYTGLRELSGYGSSAGNPGAGTEMGMVKLMLNAMQACEIPMSVLFQ